jgi:hypothetical protein
MVTRFPDDVGSVPDVDNDSRDIRGLRSLVRRLYQRCEHGKIEMTRCNWYELKHSTRFQPNFIAVGAESGRIASSRGKGSRGGVRLGWHELRLGLVAHSDIL